MKHIAKYAVIRLAKIRILKFLLAATATALMVGNGKAGPVLTGPLSISQSPGNTTYYVDPAKGDDANPAGKPWRSFTKVNALKLAPGDKVVIAAGFQEESLMPSGGGTEENPVVIQFLPGVHTFENKNAIRLPMFVSNSCDSPDPKPIGILIQNVKHLRLEGGGVDGAGKTTILYDGRMVQIFNDHSEDITYTGLVFDLKRPTVSEFRALEVGTNHAVIQVAEGSDYEVENGKFIWKGDRGNGRLYCQEAIPNEGLCWSIKDPPRGWTTEGQSEAMATDLGGRHVRLDFAAGGSGLTVGHQYHFRNILRDSVGVHNARSKDIVFRDCDFYALTGMGFVSQFTENITYQRVNVAAPKDTIRTCAAWADIFQFSNCKGDVLVDSCRLSGCQDDPINCHGTHLRIIEKIGDNQLLMRFMQSQTYGFAAYQPGDEVAVISHSILREYPGNPRRRVTAVEKESEKDWLLTLDGPVPSFETNDVLDNITWYPNLTAKNNHLSMIPSRAFLLTTRGKVLVEGNTFYHCDHGGILIEDDAKFWFESGPVRDMVIRNNRFVGCGIVIDPQTESHKPEEPVHKNIRIVDNYFDVEGDGIAVSAKNVKDEFKVPPPNKRFYGGIGVWAKNVKGLTITGNRSPKGSIPIKIESSCTETKVTNNEQMGDL